MSKPPMTIRIASQADEFAIQKLIHQVYGEFGFGWDPAGYHADIYNLETHFCLPNRFWVTECEGQIVACVGVEVFSPIPGPRKQIVDAGRLLRIGQADCELVRLYAYPEARGKGIGRALSETCVWHARAQGCKLMEIWSDLNLVDAHRLYEKMGAELLGQRICAPPDEAPEHGYALEL